MAIDYVICAAGSGTRTKKINAFIAKPLLKLNSLTLLERSLESIDFFPDDRLIVAAQKGHNLTQLDSRLRQKYPFLDIFWVEVEGLTKGQLDTAYRTCQHWRPKTSIVIFNSDTFFRSRPLLNAISLPSVHGAIPCKMEKGDNWSFCKVNGTLDGFPQVTQVAEKTRISDWCSVGYYFFQDSSLLMELIELEFKQGKTEELYVAPIYTHMLARGLGVVVVPVDLFLPMGSEEQLQNYWKIDIESMRRENRYGKIVVDLDNTLTDHSSSKSYHDKKPKEKILQKLKEYSELGFEIIIYSSRRMKTHNNDEGKIVADIAETTLEWLRKHQVPFSSLRFGKPFAENGFYIDDKAIRPDEFLNLSYEEILKLTQ